MIHRNVLLICIFGFVSVAMAVVDDVFISYSTLGPDCYADGTRVRDGECYALVCTKKGSVFAGFSANGMVASPETDDIAVIAPSALDGHCRPVVFALPKDYIEQHRTDEWTVQLVDTRNAAGRPVGLVDGVPARINGYGRVEGDISFDAGASVSFGEANVPARVSVASALPPDLVPQPVITDISVREGRVVLTVDETVPFVTYDLVGAETPSELTERSSRVAREKRDGVAGRPVVLEAEAGAEARFFKVVRAK